MNIKELRKVELHLHLDGSLRRNTVSEILGYDTDLRASDKCLDLNEYLTKFDIPISIMQTKEILTRVSRELALDLISDNVIYAEIRFAPIFHIKKGLTLEEVVEAVLDGLKETNLKTTLILCMMRGMSFEDNKKIIDLASQYNLPIDLAGAEGIYKTEEYRNLFELAKEKNIPFTIHSGEADGVDSIKSAIDFGAKRLGHGVRILESDELVKEAITKSITLEVCPTSNVQTNVVENYENHKIKQLIDKGLKVTINTDNRTVSNITLNEEYEKLVKYFDFTEDNFLELNKNAINAAFLSKEEKEDLLKIFDYNYKK